MAQTANLANVSAVVQRSIENGTISGALLAVRHRGRLVHHEAQGVADRATQAPLHPASVLWLASLTKPLIAAALLSLREQGKLELSDPVSRFIPEFAAPREVRVFEAAGGTPPAAVPAVAQRPDIVAVDPPHQLVPAERELTLRDLLTHTSGLQTITIPNSKLPVIGPEDDLGTYVPRLAKVPLDFQPGTRWAYSNAAGFDVLARVVEVVAGQSLPSVLQQRIFEPLAMTDTGFGLADHPNGLAIDPRFRASPAIGGTRYFSGAAGLWGSSDDYTRFGEMLRNGGLAGSQAGGARVLSAQSVELMTRDHVGTLFPGLNGRRRSGGLGFGLSVATVVDPAASGIALAKGAFGWDGVGTRRFWVSPSQELAFFMYVPDASVQVQVEQAVSAALG